MTVRYRLGCEAGEPGTGRRKLWFLFLFLVVSLSGCAPLTARPQPQPPLELDEIIRMSQEGVADAEIIEKIRSSGTYYRLSADEVIALRSAGVSTRVIDEIQDAYIEHVRRQQEIADRAYPFADCRWWYGPPLFYYWWYGPLPRCPCPY